MVFCKTPPFSEPGSISSQASKWLIQLGIAVLLNLAGIILVLAQAAPPNVLFIHVDDLRPQLKSYGHAQMVTPNIDALAADGFLFQRAYAQQAVCSPSRTSLMTGLRPDTTQVVDLTTDFRDTVPWVITLPQHFKNHGYHSAGLGKIYHGGPLNDGLSWSEPWSQGPKTNVEKYALQENRDIAAVHGRGPPTENADVADNAYQDGAITDIAIAKLATLKNQQPFYYGVGYYKPHLPFSAPQTYWDLYDFADLELPTNRNRAIDASRFAYTRWGELRNYYGMPVTPDPVTPEQEANLIHGYYASVSYVDAQIGRLLAALEAEGLADNTIVVFWGDHGWHLGDHGEWAKHTNFEYATRIPLLIKVPGMPGNQQISALVETVDIYPTLVELCGLPMPSHLEGDSMVSLLEDSNASWKDAVISIYPRGNIYGYSMRTDQYRYNEWQDRDTGAAVEVELYDMGADPTQDVNLASQPAFANAIASLSVQLNANVASWTPRFPALDIEKFSNGKQADGVNDYDVPRIAPGSTVTWTYDVTNTGSVAFSETEVLVTDSQPGVIPMLDIVTDDGDGILSPTETWTYTATAQAVDLARPPPAGVTVVPGCNDNRSTYENIGRVDLADIAGTGVFDEDSSHYCNMGADVDADGITDSTDNCFLIPNGPLLLDPGDNGISQRNTDGDAEGDACDDDDDNDGLLDVDEIVAGSDRLLVDTDGDGLVDGLDGQILAGSVPGGVDANDDGFVDGEQNFGSNPVLQDTDGDGFNDGEEVRRGTNPLDDASFPSIANGDLSLDGYVNAADVLIGYRILTGQVPVTPSLLMHGDVAPLVNGIPMSDGLFTLGDLLVIQRKALGQIDF